MKKIILYTDGACAYNPGPGGWACVLYYKNNKKELSGGDNNTTNNRMELTAVIKGLQILNQKCEVEVYTDSAYVYKAFADGWLQNWILKGWKGSNKKPVLNQDLWQDLLDLVEKHNVKWNKVKGHSDNENNNRCDELARAEVEKILSTQNQNSNI